ncbi:MAG: hypothetical protein V7641_4834 [Blastocatellia bacterium]
MSNDQLNETIQSLSEATQSFSEADVDKVLQQILDTSLELVNAETGALMQLEGDDLIMKAASQPERQKMGARLKVGETIRGLPIARREPILVTDIQHHPRYRLLPHSEQVNSMLAIPLRVGSQIIGVLSVESPKSNAFTTTDKDLLERFASHAAMAIKNLQLQHQLKERLDSSIALDMSTTIILANQSGVLPSPLTPAYLSSTVSPYLNAIADFQHIISEINGENPHQIRVREIKQASPISVNLTGVGQAIQIIKDTVIPWRRKHAEKMANLAEREKLVEIENRKADILEKKARAAKDRAEAKRIASDEAKQREETEKMKLENDKIRLEIHLAKIQLAMDVIAKVSPDLPEPEKIAYVVKLLAPLDTLVSSEIEITTDK